MKTRFWLVLTAMITIVACANKTEKKIDSANDDWRRMQAIDLELRNNGVLLNEPQTSAATMAEMDQGTLRRVRDLLAEFSSRGANVISTTQRKDVQIVPGIDMGKIEMYVRNSERLKMKAEETLGVGSSRCASQGISSSTARFAAEQYVGGLGRHVTDRIDFESARVNRVPPECRMAVVTYASRDGRCALRVVVDLNTASQRDSNRDFVCR